MEPITIWREDDGRLIERPDDGTGGVLPEGAWTKLRALPRADFDALVKERDALRRPRIPMDVYDTGRRAESDMDDIVYHFGVCGDWWYDPYDSSVEMSGVRDGWLPDEDQRKALADAGMRLAYLSYRDGTAVAVNTVTGAYGACSPRNTTENQSALVASLMRERDAATARADKAEAALKDALARIDAHLAAKGQTAPTPAAPTNPAPAATSGAGCTEQKEP